MSYPRKHPQEIRERVEELHALGCSDVEIHRLMPRLSKAGARSIRESLGLKRNFQEKTVFRNVCSACGATLDKYKPLCFDCWSKLPNGDRLRLGINLRWKPRKQVEVQAAFYVAEAKR